MTLTGPELLPPGGDATVKKLVVFLHGYGSKGADLLGLAPQLQKSLPQAAFLAPNAPTPLQNSYNGYQWFSIWDCTPWQIEQGLRTVMPSVGQYLAAQCKRFNVSAKDVVLVGFSQGTMLSLHAGLRRLPELDGPLAGVIGYAGAMLTPESFPGEKLSQLPPVLLVHGIMDNVVPWGASQLAADIIRNNGGTCETLFRPMLSHSIDVEGINAGIRFLQDRLGV